jgi:hypothetical protein
MKNLFLALALTAGSAMAAKWTGTIVDEKCGAKHADASEASIKCVQGCVKGGSAAVFAVGDKIYKFADAKLITDHLGHKVEIDGKLAGETITVKKVKMVN